MSAIEEGHVGKLSSPFFVFVAVILLKPCQFLAKTKSKTAGSNSKKKKNELARRRAIPSGNSVICSAQTPRDEGGIDLHRLLNIHPDSSW